MGSVVSSPIPPLVDTLRRRSSYRAASKARDRPVLAAAPRYPPTVLGTPQALHHGHHAHAYPRAHPQPRGHSLDEIREAVREVEEEEGS